jgi:cysteine desulfurase family protein
MIYLDNAATSFPKAPGVAEAVSNFLVKIGANAGRSSHKGAIESSSILFNCREALAALFGVKKSERIIFTSNTTEALNIAIMGMLKPGSRVLTSSFEHNSVMRPLNFLKSRDKIEIIRFGCDNFGFPDMKDFKKKVATLPDLLIFSAASNVTGIILPFEEMAGLASSYNVPVCIDGAQLAGHCFLDIEQCGIDLFAFPGHKALLGPTGTGGLYIGAGVNPEPLCFGGTGSRSDREVQPDFMPDKYESGTPNIAVIAGLLESVNFILKTGTDQIEKRESEALFALADGLKNINGLNIFMSDSCKRVSPVISFTHNTKSISDIARSLDLNEVAVRMGLHCAPSAHKAIKTFDKGGTVRLSPGYFTSRSDIDDALYIIKDAVK